MFSETTTFLFFLLYAISERGRRIRRCKYQTLGNETRKEIVWVERQLRIVTDNVKVREKVGDAAFFLCCSTSPTVARLCAGAESVSYLLGK